MRKKSRGEQTWGCWRSGPLIEPDFFPTSVVAGTVMAVRASPTPVARMRVELLDAAARPLGWHEAGALGEVEITITGPGAYTLRWQAQDGTEVARDEALRDGIPEYYRQAVEENDVDVIAQPELEVVSGQESGDVEFSAKVQVRPTVELHGYDAMRIEVENPTPTAEIVDAQIDQLRDRFATVEDSDFPLVDGNLALLDITGTIDGEAVAALGITDFNYQVGSGQVIAELDDALRGLKSGEEVTVDSTMPENMGDMGGKLATFTVTVKGTQQKILPDLTDEWVSEASEFETVEALREDITSRMTMMNTVQARINLRDQAVESLAGLVELDPPSPLVDAEMERRLHALAHRLDQQAMNISQ